MSYVSHINTISPPKLSLNYQNQTKTFQFCGPRRGRRRAHAGVSCRALAGRRRRWRSLTVRRRAGGGCEVAMRRRTCSWSDKPKFSSGSNFRLAPSLTISIQNRIDEIDFLRSPKSISKRGARKRDQTETESKSPQPSKSKPKSKL